MTNLTLDAANVVISAAIAKGSELNLKPLSVAVLDSGGHLIAFQRSDGASILRPEIAIGKAAGALALGVSSRKIGEMAADRPTFVSALAAIAPRGIVPAAGGVIVVDGNGETMGAVGVTGDLSDHDETCALAGIASAGLVAQP
jgi:uncharacterized protein GlcG (DUF336 family)